MKLPSFQEVDAALHVARLAACVIVAPLGLLVPASKRAPALALLGVAFVLWFAPESFPGVVVAALLTFVMMHVLARIADLVKRWNVALVAMLVVSVVFIVARGFGLDGKLVPVGRASILVFAVDMWMFLRIVSILWEVGSGKLTPPSAIVFVSWIALPFTQIGPLTRPSQFVASVQTSQPRDLGPAWRRKVLLACAQLVAAYVTTFPLAPTPTSPGWMKLAAGFSVAPWAFYFNIGGTYQLMEALGACWGIAIPMSFNAPFGRRNLADFWANWNMTATNLLRDYLFFARWGMKRPNFYLNAIIVFVLVGAWHGSNAYWILFGAYHGLGYCVYLWFRARKIQIGGGRVGAFASAALTYGFVCSAWLVPLPIVRVAAHFMGR